MISTKHRFHGLNALAGVYRRGEGARDSLLGIKVIKSRKDDYRLAVVVSRKVHKSAVIRNRIRRRIYETVRLIRKDSQSWPFDIIITVFDRSVGEMPAPQLKQNVENLLAKTGVIAVK